MSEPDTCSCFPGTCRGGDVVDGRLASGARCKQVSQADARGDEAMRQWHRECDDGDALLRMLGLDPVAYRTDGGSINLPKVREAVSPRPAQEDPAAAVVNAAREWLSERTINDWDEAALARAVILLDGDWPGCPDCDHQCDEPCVPMTVAEQLAWLDSRIAQLVHEGKLARPVGYVPPQGWKPIVGPKRRAAREAAPAGPHVALVQFIEGLLLQLGREPTQDELRAAAHALTVRADRIACVRRSGDDGA